MYSILEYVFVNKILACTLILLTGLIFFVVGRNLKYENYAITAIVGDLTELVGVCVGILGLISLLYYLSR